MKNKICYSPEALKDLDEIYTYIETELSNPQAAYDTVTVVLDGIKTLENYGESGAPVSSVTGFATDMRFLVTGNYLTFYHRKNGSVFIDRILYGRRDYIRVLFEK